MLLEPRCSGATPHSILRTCNHTLCTKSSQQRGRAPKARQRRPHGAAPPSLSVLGNLSHTGERQLRVLGCTCAPRFRGACLHGFAPRLWQQLHRVHLTCREARPRAAVLCARGCGQPGFTLWTGGPPGYLLPPGVCKSRETGSSEECGPHTDPSAPRQVAWTRSRTPGQAACAPRLLQGRGGRTAASRQQGELARRRSLRASGTPKQQRRPRRPPGRRDVGRRRTEEHRGPEGPGKPGPH